VKKHTKLPTEVLEVENYEVASWSPGAVNEGIPPTQVHFLLNLRGMAYPLVMRLKTWNAVTKLMDALKAHRDYVWKPTTPQGLDSKYIIAKTDGSPVDPGADYYLLRLDSDPAARWAAIHYADLIQEENQLLAEELRLRVRQHRANNPDPEVGDQVTYNAKKVRVLRHRPEDHTYTLLVDSDKGDVVIGCGKEDFDL
jgi:hypothetical protein